MDLGKPYKFSEELLFNLKLVKNNYLICFSVYEFESYLPIHATS